LEINHGRALDQFSLEDSKDFFTENTFKAQKGGSFQKYLESQLPLYDKRTDLG